MAEVLTIAFILAAILFPLAMMPLLWRRMKRVQAMVHAEAPSEPRREPWQEPLEADGDLVLGRASDPNEELIALGARARQSRWPIDNG
jgi:hypothetical protein